MQPKIIVWSCLHGLFYSRSLRGAAAHTSSGSHTEGMARITQDRGVGFSASIMPEPVPSSFCRLPFSWSSWIKLVHPALYSVQRFGLNTVPQKQALATFRKFCAFLCVVGRNGVGRQRLGACR